MDKTIIKILEKEIKKAETNNPEAFEFLKSQLKAGDYGYILNENEIKIYDCGFIQGLKGAVRILRGDNLVFKRPSGLVIDRHFHFDR